MMSYLADRLIQFYDDFEGFCEWIQTMKKVGVLKEVKIDKENGIVAIKGKVSTGLLRNVDPINNLVCLGFAFFGEFWAYMPDAEEAFKKVKKWWREQIKSNKMKN